MSINEILLLALTGIIAGALSGVMGVGGGIVIVPALVFLFGLSQHEAQGTSLAVLLLPVGILGVLNYHKKGFVNFQFALVIIIAFIIGSYFGSMLSVQLPEKILKRIFGVLMLFVGARMVFWK